MGMVCSLLWVMQDLYHQPKYRFLAELRASKGARSFGHIRLRRFRVVGFRALGFGVLGFQVLGLRVLGFGVLGFRVSGFRVLGFRVSGFRVFEFGVLGFRVSVPETVKLVLSRVPTSVLSATTAYAWR